MPRLPAALPVSRTDTSTSGSAFSASRAAAFAEWNEALNREATVKHNTDWASLAALRMTSRKPAGEGADVDGSVGESLSIR